MAPSADKFADPPAIDADGVLTFTPGDEPWLATVVVNAKDDGGLEDWDLPASAPYDKPDDTSDTVTFEIAIYPADRAAARRRSARRSTTSRPPWHPGAIGTSTVPVRLSWHGTDAAPG